MGIQANFAVQPRGFLGAELIDGADRVEIKSVLKDGPADRAGLKAGDVVTKLGSTPIKSVKVAVAKLADRPEGEKLPVTIRRSGAEQTITVELGRGL